MVYSIKENTRVVASLSDEQAVIEEKNSLDRLKWGVTFFTNTDSNFVKSSFSFTSESRL